VARVILAGVSHLVSIDPSTGQRRARWGNVSGSVLVFLGVWALLIRLIDWMWVSLSPEYLPASWLRVIFWGCLIGGVSTALDLRREWRALLRKSRRLRIEPQR
jgi:hypothetical protein